MKKSLFLILTILFFPPLISYAEIIKGGISILEKVPNELYGSWAVTSIQTYTKNPNLKALPGIDYWNIYRHNNVLTLENPTTNARASVTIKDVKNKKITFVRRANKNEKETIETPTITIDGENFWGKDKMIIKKFKNGGLIGTDIVEFTIIGTKLGGNSTQTLLY